MPSPSELGDVLVACEVAAAGQWEAAWRAGGGDLGRALDALAATRPPWWDGKPPAPPGLTAYQRGAIEHWLESGDPDRLRRDLALNRFVLLEKLGRGGQGEVYRARQLNPPRYVAVKTLIRDTEARRRRFEQEARTMMRVRHPAVARFHLYERVRDAAGRPTDEYLIAMEFVAGTPLHRLVRAAGPAPWPFAARWALELLDGLAEIHRLGLVHRDVKPENVMAIGPAPGPGVAPAETAVKLLDFGAVKPAGAPGEDGGAPDKVFVGTFEYGSPEQWVGEATPASDLYALGGTLFFVLTGRTPFQMDRRDPAAYRDAHRSAEIPDVRQYAPGVPPAVGRLLRRMLAKDPAHRGTAAELADGFRAVLPRSSEPAARPGRAPAAAPPRPAAGAGPQTSHPLDPVLVALERAFLPRHRLPAPGEGLARHERWAALLRRPAVLALLAVLLAVAVLLLRWAL